MNSAEVRVALAFCRPAVTSPLPPQLPPFSLGAGYAAIPTFFLNGGIRPQSRPFSSTGGYARNSAIFPQLGDTPAIPPFSLAAGYCQQSTPSSLTARYGGNPIVFLTVGFPGDARHLL
jgi:hypothetical protein